MLCWLAARSRRPQELLHSLMRQAEQLAHVADAQLEVSIERLGSLDGRSLRALGTLVEVDGVGSMDEVYARIRGAVRSLDAGARIATA